jgi:NAD(P)-dependent dehydrogenase (short-subunit alcohol dehydrogenase family)
VNAAATKGSLRDFDLSGQVAFISGTSRGLGRRFAAALARAGADIVGTSRTIESLSETKAEIESLGRSFIPLALDVTSFDSIQAAVDRAIALMGKVDILVCNAGCNRRKPAVDVTWSDWDYVVNTNLKGAFFLAQAVAKKAMLPSGYGRIITIGSVTSVAGYAGLAPYGASRGGIKQLTMALADDWGPGGITVNCLAPGWFKTDQNAMLYENQKWVEYLSERICLGRPGGERDLDGALVFLASECSRYVTGQTLLVDGGISTGRLRAMP